MSSQIFNRATHFSMVWVISLAVLTTLEWRSLDREPLKPTIMLPFIERDVRVTVGAGPEDSPSEGEERGPATLSQTVAIAFNGPLFLLCCFGPVLVFHGIGWIGERMAKRQ